MKVARCSSPSEARGTRLPGSSPAEPAPFTALALRAQPPSLLHSDPNWAAHKETLGHLDTGPTHLQEEEGLGAWLCVESGLGHDSGPSLGVLPGRMEVGRDYCENCPVTCAQCHVQCPEQNRCSKDVSPPLSRGSACLMTHARDDMLGAPSPRLSPAHPGPLSVREAGSCHHREQCGDKEGSESCPAGPQPQGFPGV